MLASLLPPHVVIEEELNPAGGAQSRGRDFAAGRQCAGRALARLGFDASPVERGPRGEPLWPPGVVGSITHCAGYAAAAVARSRDLDGLGIDAEVPARLDAQVIEIVCTERERGISATLGIELWPLVIFSAKESVFKVWYPLTGRWLEYADVQVTLDAAGSRFSAVVGGHAMTGRFAVRENLILTAVALAR